MRYKILLVSFLVLTGFITAPRAMERFSRGMALTNQWAMAAFFWSTVLDSNSATDNGPVCDAPKKAAAVRSFVSGIDTQEEFRWQGRVQAGQTFEIKGVNGNVRAEGSSGNQVEVVASKKGRKSDPKDVEIRVVEHAGGVTICAVYPSADPSRPNDCQPGRGGHVNVNNNDVSVDFIVKVPAGVRFSGHTVNGEVEAERIGSDVEASTVNGSINITASGIAQATTVNGSIKASMGQANWTNELNFNTVNGSITLDFPAGLNTDLRAETLNGDVNSDFPMNVQSGQGEDRPGRPKRIKATIGAGGRALSLKTVNGNIHIRRGAGVAF